MLSLPQMNDVCARCALTICYTAADGLPLLLDVTGTGGSPSKLLSEYPACLSDAAHAAAMSCTEAIAPRPVSPHANCLLTGATWMIPSSVNVARCLLVNGWVHMC